MRTVIMIKHGRNMSTETGVRKFLRDHDKLIRYGIGINVTDDEGADMLFTAIFDNSGDHRTAILEGIEL